MSFLVTKQLVAGAPAPRRRNRRWILLAAAACALVAIGPATAQPPPAAAPLPSKSLTARAVVELSRAPYQAYLAADCIAGSNFCKFMTEPTKGGRRLEIHRVACQGWHTSASLPSFVVIAELRTAADAFVSRIDFLETSYAPANGGSVWAISEPTLIFIPPLHRLRINLNSGTTGVGSYGCTISGYMVTLGNV